MDSIPKFLASVVTIVLGVILCVYFTISTVMVSSARTYHNSVIEEIEASNYAATTIQKCIEAAEKDNYKLTVEDYSTVESNPRCFYKVSLEYSVPVLGGARTGTLVGYALSGMYPTDPSVDIPDNPQTGDVFTYNDYEYRYNMYYVGGDTWYERTSLNGWSARVLDDSKTSYNRPLSMIGDTPVVSLIATYYDCENLLEAPEIPDTIVTMYRAYQDCVSMSDDVVIPSSVESLGSTFYGCISEEFVEPPVIPEGVVDMTHAFTDCINLKKAPKIPFSVELLSSAFYGCESMTTLPDLSRASRLEGMGSAFVGCTSLPKNLSGFEIPSTVTDGYKMFMDCTQITSAPIIPSNLTDIRNIFENCTSLTGTVTINSNPNSQYLKDAFKGTVKPILIDGSCSDATKALLVATADNGNVQIYVEESEEEPAA